jgi:thiamine-monophosphate kinase
VSLASLGERGLLSRIFKEFSGQRHPTLVLGPGDDAAVSRLAPGKVLVSTHDDQVEGTHFLRKGLDFKRLGQRLWRVNLSDLAAMGAVEPIGAIVTAGFPANVPSRWALDFLKGIAEDARRFKTPVLGGNLAKSKNLFFGMTLLGQAKKKNLVLRSGAKAGDLIAGIGPLGQAPALPEPQLKAGQILGESGLATSLIDNSDGLSASCAWLARESGVAFELGSVPKGAERGEDYGLIFTVSPRNWSRLKTLLPGMYLLGYMKRGRAEDSGFDHFKP